MPRLTVAAVLVAAACTSDSGGRSPVADAEARSPILEFSPFADSAMDTSLVSDTALGPCTAALRPPADHEQAVITAVRTAYGLESELYQRPESVTTWEHVYAHYRLGFGEDLARQMADYSWDSAGAVLRQTHVATLIPDSVGVLEGNGDEALVAWIAPSSLREAWGLPRCVVDRVVREEGRWVVVGRQP